MTTAQVVETSVTVNNNSPIQDYVHPDYQTQPFEMTPGFKPFTILSFLYIYSGLPITRALANSNLSLSRTKIDFPWISFKDLLYPR